MATCGRHASPPATCTKTTSVAMGWLHCGHSVLDSTVTMAQYLAHVYRRNRASGERLTIAVLMPCSSSPASGCKTLGCSRSDLLVEILMKAMVGWLGLQGQLPLVGGFVLIAWCGRCSHAYSFIVDRGKTKSLSVLGSWIARRNQCTSVGIVPAKRQ